MSTRTFNTHTYARFGIGTLNRRPYTAGVAPAARRSPQQPQHTRACVVRASGVTRCFGWRMGMLGCTAARESSKVGITLKLDRDAPQPRSGSKVRSLRGCVNETDLLHDWSLHWAPKP